MSPSIKTLGPGDEAVLSQVAPGVFDHDIDNLVTSEFLADHRHHIVVALDGDLVVGFVSAVHYIHPDKSSPELWINELAVAPTHRNMGLAKQLVRRLLEIGRQLKCSEAWVLTDRSNIQAMRVYETIAGKRSEVDTVMITFHL